MSEPLFRRTSRGFALNLSTGGLISATSLVTQLVLAWLLTKHDFGIYAIAIAFYDFVIVVRGAGVQRWLARLSREEFERQCGHAFLVTVLGSLVSGATICTLSFVVGWVYGQPEVTQVMLVLGAAVPFGAYSVVGLTRLQVDLRFRTLAGLRLASSVLRYGLMILLAYRGWGALSFAVPVIFVTLFELLFHLAVTRLRIRTKPISLAGARAVFRESRWSLSGDASAAILRESDYMILGLFVPTHVLGVYYFALQLTMRSVSLFSESLRWVVLPVFSRIEADRARETRSLHYGGAFLGMVAAPAMLLICVTAEPLTELLWKGRWAAAVSSIQLLGLAAPLHLLAMLSEALAQSRGRFRFWTATVLLRGAGRAFAALVASWIGGGQGLTLIAGVMASYIALSGIVQAFALFKNMRVGIEPLLSRFWPPAAVSLAAAVVILWVWPHADAQIAGLALVLRVLAYIAVLTAAFAAFCRPSARELTGMARRMLKR